MTKPDSATLALLDEAALLFGDQAATELAKKLGVTYTAIKRDPEPAAAG